MMEITWLGQAIVQFRLESGEVMVDPPDELKRELTAARSTSTQVWPLEIGKPVKW